MIIAFCFENVNPARGGCETYIADLARRLLSDGHQVHLYACRWNERALPAGMVYHGLRIGRVPRFWRPWRFSSECLKALAQNPHDVSIGFDKTYGQDVLYPQGGLHLACADYNLHKYTWRLTRRLARTLKIFDPAYWSYALLERRQYLGNTKPIIVVNSNMVKGHFLRYYGILPERLRVVRSAIDPRRFPENDRVSRRQEWRRNWALKDDEVVGLFAAMNYRLKGLDPLLHAVRCLVERPEFPDHRPPFRLLVAGNPDSNTYQKQARRLGIRHQVVFVGHCPDMRNAYFAADFLVHPTFYDPCSLVVLEALACGLPVITTRANGASELLGPVRQAYVIDDPHDHDSLAWCMMQMLDQDRRAAGVEASRHTAEHWTFDHHYQQMLEVFHEVAQRKRSNPWPLQAAG